MFCMGFLYICDKTLKENNIVSLKIVFKVIKTLLHADKYHTNCSLHGLGELLGYADTPKPEVRELKSLMPELAAIFISRKYFSIIFECIVDRGVNERWA